MIDKYTNVISFAAFVAVVSSVTNQLAYLIFSRIYSSHTSIGAGGSFLTARSAIRVFNLQSLESRQGFVIKVDDKYDDSYNGPEGELESYKAHIQFWLHYLGTKKLDGETAQHWLEKERDRLQRRLAIIEDMISGFEKL